MRHIAGMDPAESLFDRTILNYGGKEKVKVKSACRSRCQVSAAALATPRALDRGTAWTLPSIRPRAVDISMGTKISMHPAFAVSFGAALIREPLRHDVKLVSNA